ncbi:MAG TPA: carboxypeptidase regulatory-like domain-containing protein [Verrucomicrobiae bacterium]|jgi:plastocyanin
MTKERIGSKFIESAEKPDLLTNNVLWRRSSCFLFCLLFIQVSQAATLSGVVKFTGEKPKPRVLNEIAANSFCKDHAETNGVFPSSDRFVFGKKGADDTLANVLVYVSKGLEGRKFEPPKTPVVIDQINCIYVPHVCAVMAGQPIQIKNSDETLHNVMTRPRNNQNFNEGMPGTGKKLVKTFDKPELGIDLRCFMHPWMLGYVHVLDNPYFAITKSDGSWEIKDLPAGEYEISVFHEYSRFTPAPEKQTIKLSANDSKKLDFTYSMPAR